MIMSSFECDRPQTLVEEGVSVASYHALTQALQKEE